MSRSGFTNQDYLNLLITYGKCDKIISRTCREYRILYPNRPAPTGDIIRRLLSNCLTFGQFEGKPNKLHPVTQNADIEINVLAFFFAHPHASVRQAERYSGMSKASIQRILKKHRWHPYSIQLQQNIKIEDRQARVQFCEFYLMKSQEDENFTKKIIWSDEAKFTKNGIFNRKNQHYWAANNPRATSERNFQQSWSFNVYCSIKFDKIFAIYLYDKTLNGEEYVNIIQNVIRPNVERLNNEQLWYQHDGAPAHRTPEVTNMLYQVFEDRWLGFNGPFKWPARSPDLTPLDFCIWGYIKDQVYDVPPTTKEEMKSTVLNCFNNLPQDVIWKATQNEMQKRVFKCLETGGRTFEHLL